MIQHDFRKNNYDEEASVDVFFQLYDEFNNLNIQSCTSAILSEENKDFHIHNPFIPVPHFSDPQQLFLIKLSNNIGYLRVILTKEECFLESMISNHKKESTEYFHTYFGEHLNWIKDERDNEMLKNRRLTWT